MNNLKSNLCERIKIIKKIKIFGSNEENNSFNGGSVFVDLNNNKFNMISYYDYEVKQNEAKRSIRILNSIYVDDFESQFKKLMKK